MILAREGGSFCFFKSRIFCTLLFFSSLSLADNYVSSHFLFVVEGVIAMMMTVGVMVVVVIRPMVAPVTSRLLL